MPFANDEVLTRTSAYSYHCSACSRCCRNYEIRINPYEALVLSRYLGISTTELLERHLHQGISLPLKDDGNCRFLGEEGCTVHAARPLACRLYPLARLTGGGELETFRHMAPHPLTEGIYGTQGTVADFLVQQQALPFIEAGDRYLDVLCLFIDLLDRMVHDDEEGEVSRASFAHSHLFDPDSTIAAAYPSLDPSTLDPQRAMDLHIAILRRWVAENSSMETHDD